MTEQDIAQTGQTFYVRSDWEFSELPAVLHDEIEKKMHCPEEEGDPLCFALARAVMESLREQSANIAEDIEIAAIVRKRLENRTGDSLSLESTAEKLGIDLETI
jgi:hypothetical protein